MISKDTSFLSCFQWSFRCALHCTENGRGGGTVLPNGRICVTFTSRCTYSSHSFLQQLRKLLDFAIWHTKQIAVWIGFVYHHEVNKKSREICFSKPESNNCEHRYSTPASPTPSDWTGDKRSPAQSQCTLSFTYPLLEGQCSGVRIWFPGLMHILNAEHK